MGGNIDPRVVFLVARWAETIVFGIYSSLFFETLFIASKQRRDARSLPAKVFVTVTTGIYVGVALHCAFGLVELLHGYVYRPPDQIVDYFKGKAWEHNAYTGVHTMVSFLSQALLIYKCFLIWNNNWVVITVPLMLFIAYLGIEICTNIVWAQPQLIPLYKSEINAVLPLAMVNNIVTTGFIAYRLIRQHYESERGSGATSGRLNLKDIGIIILESAAINTIEIFITMVLHLANSNIQQIFISMSPPTIGIVFSLIAVRLHTFNKGKSPKAVYDVGPRWASTIQMTTLDELGTDLSSAQQDTEAGSLKGERIVFKSEP